jgi:hypothetical protein
MENNISDVITPSLSPSANSIETSIPGKNAWFYIRIVFAVLFLALMGLNIFTYLSEGTDIFGKYLGVSLLKGAEGTKKTLATTTTGGKIALDVAEGSATQLINLPESQIRKRLNKPQKNLPISGSRSVDASTNNTIKSKKNAFCYIGSENGNRRCVEIGKDDVCESNKVFPSMQLCINPYLR